MSVTCCAPQSDGGRRHDDPRWRRVLWIALGLNAAMFVVESVAGYSAQSRALQADALDFLADSANYAISLGVAGMALTWRARAALAKGASLILFGVGVLIAAIWGLANGTRPEPVTMSAVGALALAVNLFVTLMLFRFREGDANMRSVWICSRNDAVNNLLVIGAGFAVLWTGSALPDLLAALFMATLGIIGGWQVVRQARGELHGRPVDGVAA
jgi:cation diffusion facilitator family transporter